MGHIWDHIRFGSVDFTVLPLVVWLLIGLALAFDFLNGFHDAANSVATVVSTRVLSPYTAVAWAAFFNFAAFVLCPLNVAGTMGRDIIDPRIVDSGVIAATLMAACAWDLLTWYWGLPTSSSHALIGGMVGAALVKSGADALRWNGIGKTVAFMFLAPLIGLVIGMLIALGITWLFHRATPRRVDKVFRRGQLVSAALYSLGHGGNDAQKTMGIIVLLLATVMGWDQFRLPDSRANPDHAAGNPDPDPDPDGESGTGSGTEVGKGRVWVPTEVVLACHIAMGLGTLFGGWRIVKTMGQRIIKLRPVDGFGAEAGAAATLYLTILGGIPVSTTHTITGSIVGVGALKRFSAVRWGVAGRVVWAWLLTIPGAALVAAISWWLLHGIACRF
jgi:PiT family inorganic phosphate transporter